MSSQKIYKVGYATCQQRQESYYLHSLKWWSQLVSMVGDTWSMLLVHEQLAFAEQRGEYLYFHGQSDRVVPFMAHFEAQESFGLHSIGHEALKNALLMFVEIHRPLLERVLCQVGSDHVIAVDWCFGTGKDLGSKAQVRHAAAPPLLPFSLSPLPLYGALLAHTIRLLHATKRAI